MNAMMNVVAVEELDHHHQQTGLGLQALVTTTPGPSCGLTIYRRVPLHPPPQPRPPPYDPPSSTSSTPKISAEKAPHVPSAGQRGTCIARAAGPQHSGRSLPPGGSQPDSMQMNKLLQARRDAVLHRRSQQRERAQQLATAIEARVDQMAQRDWTRHSQRPRRSPAQLLEAEATMRELAVAPHSSSASQIAGHYSERPSLAMRAMRWGTYESPAPPPPPPPPPPAQQKFRPRPILAAADKPPEPKISIAGALFASATAAKMLEKHDQRASEPEPPEPQPKPEPQEQLEPLPTHTLPKPEILLAAREHELESKVDPDPDLQPELEPAETDVQNKKLVPSPTSKLPEPEISIGVCELELEPNFEPERDPLQPEPAANDVQVNHVKADWLAVAIGRRANQIRARSDATLLIQSAFRGSRVRRGRARMAAVGQIQRFWRGWSARRRVSLYWLWWEETIERHAVTKIAALWRGYSVRQLRGGLGTHTFHTQRQTDLRPHIYTPRAIPRLYEASPMRTDVETDGHGLRMEVPNPNEEDDASVEGSCLSELSDDAYWEAMIDFDAASRIQALARGWLRRKWETRLNAAIRAGKAAASSPS